MWQVPLPQGASLTFPPAEHAASQSSSANVGWGVSVEQAEVMLLWIRLNLGRFLGSERHGGVCTRMWY